MMSGPLKNEISDLKFAKLKLVFKRPKIFDKHAPMMLNVPAAPAAMVRIPFVSCVGAAASTKKPGRLSGLRSMP